MKLFKFYSFLFDIVVVGCSLSLKFSILKKFKFFSNQPTEHLIIYIFLVQSQIENAVNSVVEVVIFNFKKNKIYFNQIKKKEIIKPRSVSLFFAFTIHNRSKQCQIFARPSLTKEKLTTRATQSKTKIRICSFNNNNYY